MSDLRSSRRPLPHPSTTPLEEWPPGWLVLETASLLDEPGYIMMHEHERRAHGLPDSDEARRAFIREHRTVRGRCMECGRSFEPPTSQCPTCAEPLVFK